MNVIVIKAVMRIVLEAGSLHLEKKSTIDQNQNNYIGFDCINFINDRFPL